jgi:mRNA interferase MazF
MTTYSFGDIVLVPFPFTDQSASKKRPSVVISSDHYDYERPDLIVIAVTSQIKPASAFGELTLVEWQTAGLIKPSVIKPVLTTLEKSLVLRKLGQLQIGDWQALKQLLPMLIG